MISEKRLNLSQDQLKRYSRQISLSEIGQEGQQKLLHSSVLVIGLGGLGSAVLTYLAAAGVGKIGIVDFDTVDFSNLQRQIIHRTGNVGKLKTDSAAERVRDINPDIKLSLYPVKITPANISEIVAGYDAVVDCSDNLSTRYLTSDACVLAGKPNIYGSISRFEGMNTVFEPRKGCYRCLFAEPPPAEEISTCAEAGVFGPLPGIVGTIQATETIKLLLSIGQSLTGRLFIYDSLEMTFREIEIQRNPDCPVCGDHPTIKNLAEVDYA